ncbi:MAG: hypothetical protein M0R21_05465 [Lentimicrobiaceae bacterium]|jgi:hypothetical protein|nr:hypothetical protein [Lentimicrobiaceae bacterium]
MIKYIIKIIVLIFISFVLFQSCTPDNEEDPYVDYRDDFIGTWRFNETSLKYDISSYYPVYISKDPANSFQVLLSNFGNPGTGYSPVYGIVSENNIEIPQQNTGDGWLIKEGSGVKITSSQMEWHYKITIGGDEESHTAIAEKQ